MSHPAPELSGDTSQSTQRSLITTQLTRAGVPAASEVAGRLASDMAREFPGMGADQMYPARGESAPAPARSREPDADQTFDALVGAEHGRHYESRAVRIHNQSLADCLNLQIQCQQAHWNTISGDDPKLASLFEEIGSAMALLAQGLAERIAALDGVALGTLSAISERSGLNEYPTAQADWQSDVNTVASALRIISETVKDDAELLGELDDADGAEQLCAIGRVVDFYLGCLPEPHA